MQSLDDEKGILSMCVICEQKGFSKLLNQKKSFVEKVIVHDCFLIIGPQCCCSEKVEAPSKVFGSAGRGVYDYLDVGDRHAV